MTLDEIRELTPTELSSRKKELRQEIFHLRLQQQAGQLEKPHLLRTLRREPRGDWCTDKKACAYDNPPLPSRIHCIRLKNFLHGPHHRREYVGTS